MNTSFFSSHIGSFFIASLEHHAFLLVFYTYIFLYMLNMYIAQDEQCQRPYTTKMSKDYQCEDSHLRFGADRRFSSKIL